jgi:hypothetical protein
MNHAAVQFFLWLCFRVWALFLVFAVFIGLLTGSVTAFGFWVMLVVIGLLAFLNHLANLRLAGGNEAWVIWGGVIAVADIVGFALLALALKR